MIFSQKIHIYALFLVLFAGLSLGASGSNINPLSNLAFVSNLTSVSNLTVSLKAYPNAVVRGGLMVFVVNVSDRSSLAILPPPTICPASDPKCFGKISKYCTMLPVSRNSSSYYCVYNSLRNAPGNYSVVASARDRSGKIATSVPFAFSVLPKSRSNASANVSRTEVPVTTAYALLVNIGAKKPVQNGTAGSR